MTVEVENNARISYIDNAKGILILCIILGHIYIQGGIHELIYVFHVPAFFIISGILFNYSKTLEKPFARVLKKKVKNILVPLIFFEILGSIIYVIRFGFTQSIFGFIYNTLSFNFNNGPDWFLFVLFIDEIAFIIIYKAIKNRYAIGGIAIGLAILSMAVSHNMISKLMLCFSFIVVGYIFYIFFPKTNILAVVLSFCLVVLCALINPVVDVSQMHLGNPLIFWIGAVAGTKLALILGIYKSFSILEFYGKNSLIIMGTHQPLLLLIKELTTMKSFSLLSGGLIFIAVIILEIPIICLFNRFLPFLVGKKTTKQENI